MNECLRIGSVWLVQVGREEGGTYNVVLSGAVRYLSGRRIASRTSQKMI